MNSPAIQIDNLVKIYETNARTLRVLDSLSLRAMQGEYISIMGPSGSGKTTLFNLIGGLDSPTSGTITIEGQDITQLPPAPLALFRSRRIGTIFQTFNLVPHLTAQENVILPMLFAGETLTAARRHATELLGRVQLDDRLHHFPAQLSGGQQQRIAIARAFANHPAIILADEPTGNLDLQTGRAVIDLLIDMNRDKTVTIITATHDEKMLEFSDRVLFIREGRIEKETTGKNGSL